MKRSQKKQVKHVAVVTGTRAEFGMLKTVLSALSSRSQIKLSLIVTGAHLTTGTWREIAASGFAITCKVPMQRKGHFGHAADVQALGRGVTGLGLAFENLNVDLVIVLGDRIEALAAANAATIGGRLLAHIHGGDRAEGVADESMRHAISHLAHLHFPATRQSMRRLIRMGVLPETIYQTGSPAIDELKTIDPAKDAPTAIILKHPVGDSDWIEGQRMTRLLNQLRQMQRNGTLPGWCLFLSPNTDPGSRGIQQAYERQFGAVSQNPKVVMNPDMSHIAWSSHLGSGWFSHLPRPLFLSLLAGSRMVIGNTSCGLIEAAALGTIAINIGNRQGGREKPATVIDLPELDRKQDGAGLAKTITGILNRRQKVRPTRIYGDGHTGEKIADILSERQFSEIPLRKRLSY